MLQVSSGVGAYGGTQDVSVRPIGFTLTVVCQGLSLDGNRYFPDRSRGGQAKLPGSPEALEATAGPSTLGSMATQRLNQRQPERASNPDTPPDSTDPCGPCPRCGRVSNFAVLGSVPVTFGATYTVDHDGMHAPYDLERVSSLVCAGCKQATVVVEEKWVGDHPARDGLGTGGTVHYHGVHWWPPPSSSDLDESIPAGLRDAYSEGMRALSAKAPRAAVVMLRCTVEGLVKDRGSAAAQAALGRNLAAR